METTVRQVPDKKERRWATLAHVLAFSGILIPLANVLTPALIRRHTDSSFVRRHARSSQRFQGSMVVWGGWLVVFLGVVAGRPSWAVTENMELFLIVRHLDICLSAVLGGCAIWMYLVLCGARRAWAGQTWRYPFTAPAAWWRLRQRRRYLYRKVYQSPAWLASADFLPSLWEYRRLKRLQRQNPEAYPHPLPPMTVFGYWKQWRQGHLSPYLSPFKPHLHPLGFVVKRLRRWLGSRRRAWARGNLE